MSAAITTGLIDFFRSVSKESPMARSDFQDGSERTIYSSGIDYAPCNGVVEKQETNLKDHDVHEVIRFFNAKKLPFVWWTENRSLEAHGFQFGGVMKGISLDTAEIKNLSATPPANVELRTVKT